MCLAYPIVFPSRSLPTTTRTGLTLDLVYNPLGAFLPPPQESLELKYKQELQETFGISFNNLYTMTNIPVKRFADFLHRRGELEEVREIGQKLAR